MPHAPDNYQPPSKRATEGMDRHRGGEDEPGNQRGGNGIYQSYKYIQFRERIKAKQRKADEQRVHDIYAGLEQRSFQDYHAWLSQGNPLCVECLEQGMIKPGRVMDHIEPIEQGGAVFKEQNLQWLCDHHHNKKRSTEDRT